MYEKLKVKIWMEIWESRMATRNNLRIIKWAFYNNNNNENQSLTQIVWMIF